MHTFLHELAHVHYYASGARKKEDDCVACEKHGEGKSLSDENIRVNIREKYANQKAMEWHSSRQ